MLIFFYFSTRSQAHKFPPILKFFLSSSSSALLVKMWWKVHKIFVDDDNCWGKEIKCHTKVVSKKSPKLFIQMKSEMRRTRGHLSVMTTRTSAKIQRIFRFSPLPTHNWIVLTNSMKWSFLDGFFFGAFKSMKNRRRLLNSTERLTISLSCRGERTQFQILAHCHRRFSCHCRFHLASLSHKKLVVGQQVSSSIAQKKKQFRNQIKRHR